MRSAAYPNFRKGNRWWGHDLAPICKTAHRKHSDLGCAMAPPSLNITRIRSSVAETNNFKTSRWRISLLDGEGKARKTRVLGLETLWTENSSWAAHLPMVHSKPSLSWVNMVYLTHRLNQKTWRVFHPLRIIIASLLRLRVMPQFKRNPACTPLFLSPLK